MVFEAMHAWEWGEGGYFFYLVYPFLGGTGSLGWLVASTGLTSGEHVAALDRRRGNGVRCT
jgi:hypothetical protein